MPDAPTSCASPLAARSVVAIHNTVNERAWREILAWEQMHSECAAPPIVAALRLARTFCTPFPPFVPDRKRLCRPSPQGVRQPEARAVPRAAK